MKFLQSLGQFISAFAQPQIYGLAYNYCLDLFITNAADEDFRASRPGGQTPQLLYGNQPNSAVILHNLQQYERRLHEAIPELAARYLDELKTKEVDINVEQFLFCVVYSNPIDRTCDRRSSVTSVSESDDTGISVLSESVSVSGCSETFKRYDSRKMYTNMPPSYGEKPKAPASVIEDDILGKFMKLCAPLKNNFVDGPMMDYSPLKGSYQGDDMDPRTRRGMLFGNAEFFYGSKSDGNSYDLSRQAFSILQSTLNQDSHDQFEEPPSQSPSSSLDEIQLRSANPIPFTEPESKVDDNTNNNSSIMNAFGDTSTENTLNNNLNAMPHNVSPNQSLLEGFNSDNNNDNVFLDDDTAANLPPPPPIPSSSCGKTSPKKTAHDLDPDSDELAEFNSHRYWYIPPTPISDLEDLNMVNSNLRGFLNRDSHNSLDKELKRSPSAESTILVTSDIDDTLEASGISTGLCRKKVRRPSQDLFNPELIETEWSLVEDFIHMKEIDNDMLYQCAYYFPAVMFTLGRNFWPLLQSHYIELCYNFQASVRKTMAASISQVALIIGREHTTRDLVAPYLEFLRDVDEIKTEVVKTMAIFVKVVDPSEHDRVISQLGICLSSPFKKVGNWRFREMLGMQIMELVKISNQINKESCLLYLLGIGMKLMTDKYDCVRKVGVDAFVETFRHIDQQQRVLKFFSDYFAHHINWKRRQLYIITVDKMVSKQKNFSIFLLTLESLPEKIFEDEKQLFFLTG